MPNISFASGQTSTNAFTPVGAQFIPDGESVEIGCHTGYVIDGHPAMQLTDNVCLSVCLCL